MYDTGRSMVENTWIPAEGHTGGSVTCQLSWSLNIMLGGCQFLPKAHLTCEEKMVESVPE